MRHGFRFHGILEHMPAGFQFHYGEYDPVNSVGWAFAPCYSSHRRKQSEIHEFRSHPLYVNCVSLAHETLLGAYLYDGDYYNHVSKEYEPIAEGLALAEIWTWNKKIYEEVKRDIRNKLEVDIATSLVTVCDSAIKLFQNNPQAIDLLPETLRFLIGSLVGTTNYWKQSLVKMKYVWDVPTTDEHFASFLLLKIATLVSMLSFDTDHDRILDYLTEWAMDFDAAYHGKKLHERVLYISPFELEVISLTQRMQDITPAVLDLIRLYQLEKFRDFTRLIFVLSNCQRILEGELIPIATSSILASVFHCFSEWHVYAIRTSNPHVICNLLPIKVPMFGRYMILADGLKYVEDFPQENLLFEQLEFATINETIKDAGAKDPIKHVASTFTKHVRQILIKNGLSSSEDALERLYSIYFTTKRTADEDWPYFESRSWQQCFHLVKRFLAGFDVNTLADRFEEGINNLIQNRFEQDDVIEKAKRSIYEVQALNERNRIEALRSLLWDKSKCEQHVKGLWYVNLDDFLQRSVHCNYSNPEPTSEV